jgi:hypothetical protein
MNASEGTNSSAKYGASHHVCHSNEGICGGHGKSCAEVSRHRRRCDLPCATDGSTESRRSKLLKAARCSGRAMAPRDGVMMPEGPPRGTGNVHLGSLEVVGSQKTRDLVRGATTARHRSPCGLVAACYTSGSGLASFCVCLLLQDLLQSCARGGGGEWRTCAMRYEVLL